MKNGGTEEREKTKSGKGDRREATDNNKKGQQKGGQKEER